MFTVASAKSASCTFAVTDSGRAAEDTLEELRSFCTMEQDDYLRIRDMCRASTHVPSAGTRYVLPVLTLDDMRAGPDASLGSLLELREPAGFAPYPIGIALQAILAYDGRRMPSSCVMFAHEPYAYRRNPASPWLRQLTLGAFFNRRGDHKLIPYRVRTDRPVRGHETVAFGVCLDE